MEKVYSTFVTMSDGTQLWTGINLPGPGRYPVILMRNPYVTDDPEASLKGIQELAEPFTENGFGIIMQHCRGRGCSEGEFIPFHHERQDGLVTLAWIEQQPWFDGSIYLFGGSYLCYVHLAMMDSLPFSVKGAFLSVMCTDISKAFFKNGIFKSDLGATWYLNMYHQWDLLQGGDFSAYYKTEWPKQPMSDYMQRCYGYDVPPFQQMWQGRNDPAGDPDGFSTAMHAAEKCRIPVLLLDGYGEMFYDGIPQMWRQLPEETRKKSAFFIGPWSHGCSVAEDWHYPFVNGNPPPKLEIEWFLHLRDGTPLTNVTEGAVNYYCTGEDCWQAEPDFPAGEAEKEYYLTPEGGLQVTPVKAATVCYRYDPKDPVWLPGGVNTFVTPPAGHADQPEPDFRQDFKSFVSSVLEQPVCLSGCPTVQLAVSTDCEITMFIARLSCVQQNGIATLIQDCPMLTQEKAPGEKSVLLLKMNPVYWQFRKGERIRLDITSSDSHSYAVHPNLAGNWFTQTKTRVANNTLYLQDSRLVLPVRESR